MEKNKFKIGVIGVGSMGKHHARICFHHIPGITLAGIVDPDQERAAEISRLYHCPVFESYHDLFPEADALIIASPTETHFSIARDCLDAGKSVLVEKPLAKTSEEAHQLVGLAKAKNLTLAAGMIERFNPAYKELEKLVKNEKIHGIDIKRFSPFPERITDANVIQDMMIHDLDLLASLLPGDQIEDIKAEGKRVKSETLDQVNATFYYKSGIIAKASADRIFGIKTRKISVITEKDIIEADLLNKRVYRRDFQHHVPSIHHVKDYDQLTAEIKDFVNAVKQSAAPKVSGESAYQSLKLAEEVERACS